MRHPARFFPLFLCSLLLFTSCFFSVALGDDDPSVAVVSISGYDNLMEHAAAIGEIVGFPNAQQMIQLQLMQLTGGKPLAGLDKTKPIVVDIKLGQAEPYGIACLPVTDLEKLLAQCQQHWQRLKMWEMVFSYSRQLQIPCTPRRETVGLILQIKKNTWPVSRKIRLRLLVIYQASISLPGGQKCKIFPKKSAPSSSVFLNS